jgi:hypothetical protein
MSAALKLAPPEPDETPCLSDCDPLRTALDEAAAMVRIAKAECERAEAVLLAALQRARAARERLEMSCGLVEAVAEELGKRCR